MAKYDNFKRRKLEICPNHPKILAISKDESWKSAQILRKSWQFHIFLPWNVMILWEIFQKSHLTLLLGSWDHFFFTDWHCRLHRTKSICLRCIDFSIPKMQTQNFVQTNFRQNFRLFQFQKMQAQILLNGSPLVTSSKSKHIALDKLGIRSPDCVLSRTRSRFQGYYYYYSYYYKPLAGIRTRRVRGCTPRVRASSTANSNEEELENSAAAAGAEEVRLGFRA